MLGAVERQMAWDTQRIEGWWSMLRHMESLAGNMTLGTCSIQLGVKLGSTVTYRNDNGV